MVDERDDAPRPSDADGGALAAQIALSGDARKSNEAREYLRKQSRIADLQIDTLQKKDEFELSHLRFRRYSDWTKFALEIAGVLVVLLIVCGLATMVWNASQDRDLVVDAFSVPPDVAQSGMTGSVVAGRILDRFGRMQLQTFAFSQGAASYRGSTNEVRVEIPSTGISLGELNRYLREWLGHEVHVNGDLVHVGQGFALTTRYGAEPGATVTGKQSDLERLVNNSAEQIFAAAQPYRYVEYLVRKRRFAEASALLPDLAQRGNAKDRALANEDWAKVYFFQGDMPHALERGREAVRLDPDSSLSHGWLGAAEGNVGHDEPGYVNIDAAVRLFGENSGADEAVFLRFALEAYRDEYTGDFADAVRAWTQLADIQPLPDPNAAGSASGDAAADHELSAARRFAAEIGSKDRLGRPEAQQPASLFYIHLAEGDWAGAVQDGAAAKAILNTQPDQKWAAFLLAPDVAYATARAGDHNTADAMVANMPVDCDTCMRAQGRIAALEGRWTDAARDFAVVAARSPHEPFAETFWGEMLLRKGEYDGAIAKFEIAHVKGPHFTDPLEMWGEALIGKNRSDLALAKFEEANKYAPNWGRLHLKWGEALYFAGKKDEARNQFSLASNLDLSPPDRAALAKWTIKNG